MSGVLEEGVILFLTFRNFSEAVLDIYNCENVSLDHICLFNNFGQGLVRESVRGNTGGIAIGYNMLPPQFANPTLTISHCKFIGNEARGFLSSEEAVMDQVFQGRGGGVGLYMNESQHDIDIEITDCIFENNMAKQFGGGMFILTNSYETVQHTSRVERCQFVNNIGFSGGAGVQMSFLGSGDTNRPHIFTFRDVIVRGNRGRTGGGISVFG